jgi:hypothetical protein
MGEWAKANPGKTAAIIGVLTTLAAVAGGPAGGAIAGQILKGAAELMKGEKLSTAVGKGAFVSPANTPPTSPTAVSPSLLDAVKKSTEDLKRVNEINQALIDKIKGTVKIPDTPTSSGISQSSLPGFQDYRASERSGISVVVNNAGSVVTSDDLNETVRNGILAGQTSGRSINARVLDL